MIKEPEELFEDVLNQIKDFNNISDNEKIQFLINIKDFLSLAFNLGNN